MKKLFLIGLLAFGGAAVASSSHEAAAQPLGGLSTVTLAHAGHMHGDGDKAAHSAAANANANAKVSHTLAVSSCWIRSLPAPAPSAAYFMVKNTGDKAVKLQTASSPTYGMVMLHETTDKDGMSKMSMTHDIAIAAGAELEFKPGGYHAMLENAPDAPAIGIKVTMDFFFDNGQKATALCDVKPANTQAP